MIGCPSRSPLSLWSPAEPPLMHLDSGVSDQRRELHRRAVCVRRLQQNRRTEYQGTVVGQERPPGHQPVAERSVVGVHCCFQAPEEVAVVVRPATTEIPQVATQGVGPPSEYHVAVGACLITGFLEGERACGGGIWQITRMCTLPVRVPSLANVGPQRSLRRTDPCRTSAAPPSAYVGASIQSDRGVAEEFHPRSLAEPPDKRDVRGVGRAHRRMWMWSTRH